LYSILKTLLKHSNASVVLIDCNRTWADVVFARAIMGLEQANSDRLQVFHFLSRQASSADIPSKNLYTERLNKLILKKTLRKFLSGTNTEAEYFLCGPNGLISLCKEVLEALEVPPRQIHIEHFLTTDKAYTSVELPRTIKDVQLQYYGVTRALRIQPGKSILETALEDGIPLRHSCKSGTCGKCAAKQVAGKIHMEKNFALTEEDLKQGYVLLCQSHPLDDATIICVE
jgi:ferredoxin-NADP reductase